MTTTNFATSGERASKLAGRSINRERDKPECYRKLRSRSASPTFSTPPKVVVVSLETSRLSQCPPPFTSRPTPPSHKADLIKCTLSNNDHISRVVFLHGGCISLSLSLSPAFLPSWKASTREASMKMKGLDVAPLPPSLPPSANPKGARREGKDGGIYVRNGKYSCESSYICQQTFHATVALIFDPLKNAPGRGSGMIIIVVRGGILR